MPKYRKLDLTAEQKTELVKTRDTHPKPYMREKASALLQVAEGKPPARVAAEGLLKKRDPDSVYSWLSRYEKDGIKGLEIAQGRGRKPSFSPSI